MLIVLTIFSHQNPLNPEIILRMDNRFDYYPVTVESVYENEKKGLQYVLLHNIRTDFEMLSLCVDEQMHLERSLRWYVDHFAEDNEGERLPWPNLFFTVFVVRYLQAKKVVIPHII